MKHMASKQETIKEQLAGYLKASKAGKGVILDALVLTTGYVRKAVIRRLQGLSRKSNAPPALKRGRPRYYNSQVNEALRFVWNLSHELCGERLQPHLAAYVEQLQRYHNWAYDTGTTKLLLEMSITTVKRRVATFQKEQTMPPQRGLSSTKPGLLKELVPIRRGPWDNPLPGYGEIDTVVHSGSSLLGDLTYTVQYTDVRTLWIALEAQWNKGQRATLVSIRAMRSRLPFALLGMDPDSGSEFVNWHCYLWCKEEKIELTRIRPGKKNDHGRIEQKNYANIRQFIGYIRLDRQEQVTLLQQVYEVLEVYLDYCIPSQKCLRKERIGSRYIRVYDEAQTPYQRALEEPGIPEEIKEQLKKKYESINLVELKATLDQRLKKLVDSLK